MVDISAYKYFFFVNSSVRGPYLPAYARVSMQAAKALDCASAAPAVGAAAATAAAAQTVRC
jgi:hypothetical protein